MLFDRENWPQHRRVAWLTGMLALMATAGFAIASWGKPYWPSGGSWAGIILGAFGGGIVLFEFLLWPRKVLFRTWRIGRTQKWMIAHIWFGLLCLPVLVFHSGFRLGGPLSSMVMILLVAVVLSGVIGAILQQYLPRRMLADVPSETIYSQIPEVLKNLLKESKRLVDLTCGPEENMPDRTATDPSQEEAFITIGAIRSAGPVQGRVLETRSIAAPVPNSKLLREFFNKNVIPFLEGQPGAPAALGNRGRADALFRDLRIKLDPAAHPAIDQLENACAQKRQLDVQKWLSFWLHSWLWIHLPLSVALVVLMFVHVWAAFRY